MVTANDESFLSEYFLHGDATNMEIMHAFGFCEVVYVICS